MQHLQGLIHFFELPSVHGKNQHCQILSNYAWSWLLAVSCFEVFVEFFSPFLLCLQPLVLVSCCCFAAFPRYLLPSLSLPPTERAKTRRLKRTAEIFHCYLCTVIKPAASLCTWIQDLLHPPPHVALAELLFLAVFYWATHASEWQECMRIAIFVFHQDTSSYILTHFPKSSD